MIHGFSYGHKIWILYKGKPLIGEGRYLLLKHISTTRSLKKSADSLGISYKTAYNYINKIEHRLSQKIIKSHKGGKEAGGYTELTPLGKELMKNYEEAMRRYHD